ncbi:4'-phosphopantetheinyl transferase superfamily protein [Paucibacter sp. APW11]|uniref:Enterobactin synthase component D n=1 Tax=Roseateles aquae TaxID=3077235 RepID=A0ABU3P570_9BURK|nr:4'-phosphopantetheinyl transferase superfamily protein [Paucibacter sp. APW11]MDT8997726.1 4'-phosphopantetheinyl transferase superfamily protein [Paucibacter sp. APW11]
MLELSQGLPAWRALPAPPGVSCVGVGLADVAAALPTQGQPLVALLEQLSDAERQCLARFPLRKRRIEWLAGRLAAKTALQRSSAALPRPDQAEVRQAQDRRPSFAHTHLSISHSRREALAAVAAQAVGVDTETYDAMRADSLQLLIRDDESQALATDLGCDLQAARTLAWCIKEALFKAAGQGAFASFARALQLQGWRHDQQLPAWRWLSDEIRAPVPSLAPWQLRYGLEAEAAWALVVATPCPATPQG